jgi:Ca-activated chloride channel family protein
MYYALSEKQGPRAIGLLSVITVMISSVGAQGRRAQERPSEKQSSNSSSAGQIRIPNRPQKPFFQGQQGKQKTEIHFDPATGMVTLKLLVQDPSGYFIPNLRLSNFAVYENGVRQQNVTVDIEHAPVSLGLLVEYGGRYPALNKAFFQEASRVAHQVFDVLGPDDKLAIWMYGDTVRQLSDFSTDHKALDNTFYSLQPPGVSEVNLYDALISASEHMRHVAGRKAIILISSGVDTFSKATYHDVLRAVQNSNAPVYVISMLPTLRETIRLHGPEDAMAAIDWKHAENGLMEIARVSGGRFYSPDNTADLSGTYDDIMENLKVRYVIRYKSSIPTDPNSPRTVRVELTNPSTGGPLKILDANGRTVSAKVIIQDSYTPRTAARE